MEVQGNWDTEKIIGARHRNRARLLLLFGLPFAAFAVLGLVLGEGAQVVFFGIGAVITACFGANELYAAAHLEESGRCEIIRSQLAETPMEAVFDLINADLSGGRMYGPLLVGEQWIWADAGCTAILRKNLAGFYLFERMQGAGKGRDYYWNLILMDRCGHEAVAVRSKGSYGCKKAREGYQALKHLHPEINHSEDLDEYKRILADGR